MTKGGRAYDALKEIKRHLPFLAVLKLKYNNKNKGNTANMSKYKDTINKNKEIVTKCNTICSYTVHTEGWKAISKVPNLDDKFVAK